MELQEIISEEELTSMLSELKNRFDKMLSQKIEVSDKSSINRIKKLNKYLIKELGQAINTIAWLELEIKPEEE